MENSLDISLVDDDLCDELARTLTVERGASGWRSSR
jgi:hypothetical protein